MCVLCLPRCSDHRRRAHHHNCGCDMDLQERPAGAHPPEGRRSLRCNGLMIFNINKQYVYLAKRSIERSRHENSFIHRVIIIINQIILFIATLRDYCDVYAYRGAVLKRDTRRNPRGYRETCAISTGNIDKSCHACAFSLGRASHPSLLMYTYYNSALA